VQCIKDELSGNVSGNTIQKSNESLMVLKRRANVVHESLQRLIEVVAWRSRDAQLELARSVADLRIPDTHRLTEMDRAQMAGIIAKLIHSIELDLRLNLADALPAELPRYTELLRMLADDRVEIAQSILEHHPDIIDPALIALVKARSDEHRLMLALRAQASIGVQMLHNGNAQDVMETLLRHREPNVSRRAMEYLVAETKRTDRFDEPILTVSEVPIALMEKLVWMISAALRAPLMRDFYISNVTMDFALQTGARRVFLDQGEQQNLLSRAQRLVHQIDEVGELTDAFLMRCLRQQRVYLFVCGMAHRSNVSFQTLWQIFTDKSLKSVAVLARAIGMSREAVSAMLLSLSDAYSGHDARAPENAVELLTMYDDISNEQAEEALKIWTRDPGYQRAIDRLSFKMRESDG
jgi:uncharacterized protein (DUF2336 family)